MTPTIAKKALMAEMLVERVLGGWNSEAFVEVCRDRGIRVEDAVRSALQEFLAKNAPSLKVVPTFAETSLIDGFMLPDLTDVPQGEESHWIEVCQHDLNVLRGNLALCARQGDRLGEVRLSRLIDRYLETLAGLRERVA